MAAVTREGQLVATFVELADTLVADYDVVDLLYRLVERCAHTLDAADAGILLPNGDGTLEVVASTSERSHLIGLLQLDEGQGPCVDAFKSGRRVTVDDIESTRERWPAFAASAGALGYQSMHAIPMRLRSETIGSLNVFGDRPGPLSPEDATVAQGLADIATIGILHERAIREADIARQQLQHALDSRVIIEQAKGVIAAQTGHDPDDAFTTLRAHARHRGIRLTDLARQVVDRTVDLTTTGV